MTQLYTLNIGTAYQFSFRAPAILGTGLENATVQALLDYESAQRLEDVDGIHASVLPLLPTGTPADPAKLIYVKLKIGEGQPRVIALDWIAQQPVEISSQSVIVTVANCPPNRRIQLAAMLRANGFAEFTME
jgi:hypothetical protein